MGAFDPTRFTSADAETIHKKARWFARRYCLPQSAVDDLGQELSLHVWLRLSRFDASRGTSRAAYIDVVAKHQAANIAESGRAQKRDRRRDRQDDRYLLLEGPDSRDEIDLCLDVREALEMLPADLRGLALRLQSQSVAEIERTTGLTRGQVRHRMGFLRGHFEKLGLNPIRQQPIAPRLR